MQEVTESRFFGAPPTPPSIFAKIFKTLELGVDLEGKIFILLGLA